MTNRIWVYTLAVLVFVIPICTVATMNLEQQSELRGRNHDGGHHLACRKDCDSRRVTKGRCGNGHNCEGGCGSRYQYEESWCVDREGGPLFNCSTQDFWPTTANVLECDCDPVFNWCDIDNAIRRQETIYTRQCVNKCFC